MAVRRMHGANNQAGTLAPVVSPWGQALHAGTPQLIERPLPIGTRKHNFGGTVGGVSTVSASVVSIGGQLGYFGDLPTLEQDRVLAPEPWERP